VLSRGVAPGQLLAIPVLLVFGYPFIVLWGVLISGAVLSESFGYWMLFLSAYLLFAFLPAAMAQLYALDPLPLSRRRIFALIVVPLLLLLSAGYGAGWTAVRLLGEPSPRVRFQEAASEGVVPPYPSQPATVRVPAGLCRIAWDGQPPQNVSPWGEAHPPWTVPLVSGGTAVLYSPYSTPEGSSPEFVALQISRAVEAVYGKSIPPSEIQTRYLEVDDQGAVVPRKAGGLTLRHDYPDLIARRGVPRFPVFMLITLVLYLLTSSVYFRSYRVTVSDRRRLVIFFTLGGCLFVLHLVLTVLFITRAIREVAFSGVMTIFTHAMTTFLPGGVFTLWVVCALLTWGVYRFAESRFERVEAAMPARKQEA
jgi:hypothetical protein